MIFPELLGKTPSKLEKQEIVEDTESINAQYGADFDVRELMKAAKDPLTGTLRDLKIDDRDIPVAKNYYDWCFRVSGGQDKPWARQLWVMLKFFNELCPVCNSRAMFSDILSFDKDMDSEELGDKLVIFENGVCPNCHGRKSILVKEQKLSLYDELVLCWGQRCVTGDTLVLTENGLEYFRDLAKDQARGFTPHSVKYHNGIALEAAHNFYVAPHKEQVYKLECSGGTTIKGTSDHPLLTPIGFKRLAHLEVGDFVGVRLGTNQWGTHIPTYTEAWAAACNNDTAVVRTKIFRSSGSITLDWATFLGLWIAEGRGTVVANTAPEVLSFLDTVLLDHFSIRYITKRKGGRYICGGKGKSYLEAFIGNLTRGSAKHFIPTSLMTAPKPYVCAFLRGLFEGDGGMDGDTLSYTTISKRLATELMVVLRNLGVYARLAKGWTWATNGSANQVSKRRYSLYIRGANDLKVFAANVGFLTSRKQKLLSAAIHRGDSRTNNVPHARDILPPVVRTEVQKLYRDIAEAVSEFPYPNALNIKGKDRYGARQRADSLGIRAITSGSPYYWRTGHAGVDMKRLMRSQVPLTKDKLKLILSQFRVHSAYLPAKLLHTMNWLQEFTDDKLIWCKVKGKVKSIKAYQTYDVELPETHQFIANSLVNHNSGKSTTGVSGAAYHLHRFLKFPMFGTLTPSMSVATPLSGSFVSLNFGKAFTTLWQPLKNLISGIPWYLELFKILDYYGSQYGEELYLRRKESLQFNHKNLILRPCSPSWDALRGDTRFLAMIDELGLFRLPGEDADDEEGEDDSQRANADEAHKSLDNSLLTVRTAAENLLYKGIDATPTGVLMGVSSPTSMRDKVMRLLAECSTDVGSQHMLGSQLPTWEVNPSISRNSRAIINAYAKNASKAERDFGANPVSAASAYMEASTVLPMFGKYKSTHILRPIHGPNGDMWAVATRLRPVTVPTILVIDAGYTNNSFSIVVLSYDKGSVKTECVCELMPRDGLRINFNKLYLGAIKPIADDNFSVVMAADQWQGIDTLSRFVADNAYKKAKSKRFSLSRKNFDAVRSLIEDGMFLQPKPEMDITEIMQNPDLVTNYRTFFTAKPIAHLAHQFITIRDVGPTKCPTKGIGWTDDVARAWFLGAYLIQDANVQKILAQAAQFMPKTATGHGTVGIYRSRF